MAETRILNKDRDVIGNFFSTLLVRNNAGGPFEQFEASWCHDVRHLISYNCCTTPMELGGRGCKKALLNIKCCTFMSQPFLDRHKSGPPSSLALLLNVTVGEKVQLFFLPLFQFNLAYSHHIDSKQPVWNQPPCTLATPWILTIWNNSDSQLVHGKSALSNYMLKK